MKKDEEIKKLINNWKNSVKYAEFNLKRIEQRTSAIKINTKIMNQDNIIEEDEFVKMLNLLIDVYTTPTDDDYLTDDLLQSIGTAAEIIEDHEIKLSIWHIYLYMYIKEEKYEVADLIKKVILLEQKEFFNIIKSFRYDLYTDEGFVEKIQLNYITYKELLIKKLGL